MQTPNPNDLTRKGDYGDNPGVYDAEATVLSNGTPKGTDEPTSHSATSHSATSHSATSHSEHLTDNDVLPNDDFVINSPSADNFSWTNSNLSANMPPLPAPGFASGIAENHSPLPAGSSFGSKYDLSKRVMRTNFQPAQTDESEPQKYGIHSIVRVHQKGGMGRILVAYDQFLKRDIAIKELHADVAQDESIVRRFIGEAEITAQLEHPGVVPIHRLCQSQDGLPYYTMKMIKGETLQDAIKAYHQKPNQAALLHLIRRLVSVSRTIAFAHDKGIIHRDLKPANVMLGEYGETLVMDWGLAKPYISASNDQISVETDENGMANNADSPSDQHAGDALNLDLTTVGAIIGTPTFMSPEQANALDDIIGPVSDVFSLGAVLYCLLTGRTPFYGRSTQEVLEEVRECNIIPPSQIRPYVPPSLEAVCMKAMSKLPEDRYQSATEFAADLCRWLDNEPVSAEKRSRLTRLRYWMRQHRILTFGVPSVLFLSLLFASIGVLAFDRLRNPDLYDTSRPESRESNDGVAEQ